MTHLKTFFERIDKRARIDPLFSVLATILALAIVVPTIGLVLFVFVLYPILILVLPAIALGWIVKVGLGK